MTKVAGRYSSAVFLACVGLAISSCTVDNEPQDAARQLAEVVTQRVCDILETCCLDANFPYREEGCEALNGPKISQHFNARVFFGAELDEEAAQRCLDSIGKVSDGCPVAHAVGELTEACDWVFKGTVPLGGECDSRHGCATTREAPLFCHRASDSRGESLANSGVCMADPPLAAVHKSLGDACSSTCIGDLCLGTGSEATCYTSDGLVCSWQSNECELQGVSGDPCNGTIPLITGETMHRQARGVAEQLGGGDFLAMRHCVIGEFPVDEVLVDVLVEIQLSLLCQL
jgi:hypothetical protein